VSVTFILMYSYVGCVAMLCDGLVPRFQGAVDSVLRLVNLPAVRCCGTSVPAHLMTLCHITHGFVLVFINISVKLAHRCSEMC